VAERVIFNAAGRCADGMRFFRKQPRGAGIGGNGAECRGRHGGGGLHRWQNGGGDSGGAIFNTGADGGSLWVSYDCQFLAGAPNRLSGATRGLAAWGNGLQTPMARMASRQRLSGGIFNESGTVHRVPVQHFNDNQRNRGTRWRAENQEPTEDRRGAGHIRWPGWWRRYLQQRRYGRDEFHRSTKSVSPVKAATEALGRGGDWGAMVVTAGAGDSGTGRRICNSGMAQC